MTEEKQKKTKWKLSSQNVASIIKILFVLSLIGIIIFQYSENVPLHQAVQDQEAQIIYLESEVQMLNENIYSLSTELDGLQLKYEKLSENYSLITDDYDSLLVSFTSLSSSMSRIMTQYESIQRHSSILETSYASLKTSYDKLLATIEAFSKDYNGISGVIILSWNISWLDGFFYDRSNTLDVTIFNFYKRCKITIQVWGTEGNMHTFSFTVPSGKSSVQAFWTDGLRLGYGNVKILSVEN